MTFLKSLRLLPALLGVAATLAAVSTTLFGDVRPGTNPPASTEPAPRADAGRLVDELAANRFSKLPVVAYQPRDGELLFAWQLLPTIDAPTPRPRDLLVMVDTTASQAGRPLKQARQIITALAGSMKPEDRMSVWSLSTPAATRALTKDFQHADSADLKQAAVSLTDIEYGSGAADLKHGITKAIATINPNRGRHQVVLYIGDGESNFNPVSEADRLALGQEMNHRDIYFFAVPLGLRLDSHNLHGLATFTGGEVVRVQEDLTHTIKMAEFIARLKTSFDVPVLKPTEWKFGDEVGESYPTRLPPLRADRPTLVMGKVVKPAANAVTATVTGRVNGKEITLNFKNPLPEPQIEHFFLNRMLEQWRDAPHKDAPAMLQSDRALALASTQVKLYREEFLTQAVWAVSANQFDDAEKLYKAALKIDPTSKEAVSGVDLVTKMKAGKISKAALAEKVTKKTGAVQINGDTIREVVRDPSAQPDPKDPPVGAEPPNPNAAQDLLAEAAARRQIEEQRYKVLVDATIRRGRQLLRTDPDAAYQDLKRQRDEIIGYGGIGDDARRQMVADLESVMREVFVKGAEIKRQADAERQAIARTTQRLKEFDRWEDETARDQNRLNQFRQLMQQARFELAYQEAQLMIQEKVVRGLPIEPTSVATYIIGQQATQLREWKELVRIREDRFLMAMMQSEKSHIPYPDEPAVHFPPAAVWRELTSLRREAYLHSGLGPNPTESQKQLKSIIEDTEIDLGERNINDLPLLELLSFLSTKHKITFIIMEEFFAAEGQPNIKEARPKLATTQLRGLKLGNFLDIVLLSMNATFIVRPDYVEITTFDRRLEEKVVRVFPVEDLVIPIPQSVDQSTLFQNLFFQNQTLNIFGQASLYGGGLQQIGGAFGNQFGQNLGNNPLNQQGNPGPFGNNAAQFGIQGGQNLGAQGGFTGVGGGQLGQFGNLGGQFGLQGGDQSQLLLQLIYETVARGEWASLPNANPQPGMGMDPEIPILPAQQLNALGFYPPARALIIRGTSRYHPASSIKLKRQGDPLAVGPAKPGGGQIVIGPGGPDKPKEPQVAAVPQGPIGPKVDATAERKKLGNDPKTMWSDAIARTVTDPGLIVACAEFLMDFDEYSHAAEVLKGNLRKGLATDSWAHEALAIALEAANANPVEVERAAVSAIDLEPTSAKAYLKAAKAEANLKNHNQAFLFCKRAAECSPNDPTPYANALAYAEFASDIKSDAVMWAANNLMKRDWNSSDGINYHKEVADRLPKVEAKLKAAGKDTTQLAKAITEQNQRDLVIELLWQGNADLDLIVAEPPGSICSATNTRSSGGGVLKGDILEQRNDRSEMYIAASAFSGTYKVTVKQAFGEPIGGRATLKVTKFKGTPEEAVDLIDIPLTNAKPIEIKLVGGSRITLADLSEELATVDLRSEHTGSSLTSGVSGLGGGGGTAGSVLSSPMTTSGGPALPVVASSTEMRMPGVAAGAADIRAIYKLNPDRKSYSVTVNPVFAGKGEAAMPTVPLLPGGEGKK